MKNISPFFAPDSVLIVGASRNEFTFNWQIVKNLRELMYKGEIFVINPNADEILGVKCYSSLEKLPKIPDLCIVLLMKNIVVTVQELAKFGIKNCIIQSDLNISNNHEQIMGELRQISEENDMLIIGPGSIGLINTTNYFTSSIIPVRRHIIQNHRKNRTNGSLSFFAESGGLSGALGWWNPIQEFPISKVIHIGESVNVSSAEMIQYLFDDLETQVISLYLRSLTQELIDVIKSNVSRKPVLYKYVGNQSSLLDDLRTTLAIEVKNYIELFEFAKVFLWCPPPKGNSIGIIGPSSGAIHLIISEMQNTELNLATELNPQTKKLILDHVGGSTSAEGNPVDYWPPKKFIGIDVCNVYYVSSNALLEDSKVDALFLALEFFSEIEFDFGIFASIQKRFPHKPIIAVLIMAEKEGRERIISCSRKLHIPVFVEEVERAIRAYSVFVQYHLRK
jgi:acyl-CoA synthetase (NDP forming)